MEGILLFLCTSGLYSVFTKTVKESNVLKENHIYDAIVVGLGAHGSSSVAHLAKRGASVLGIEKFGKTHVNGSSHGKSRVIRQAYFEDPSYVPLVRRSFQLWRELQIEIDELEKDKISSREPLYTNTGGLMLGYPDSAIIKGTLASVKQHDLPHEILTSNQIRERFPVFNPNEKEVGILEEEAGILIPELCIETNHKIAEHYNANLKFNESVSKWTVINEGKSNEHIEVMTASGDVQRTKKLILTVGGWAPELYGHLIDTKISCERRVLFWFQPKNNDVEKFKDIPVYIWCDKVYGFPYKVGSPGGVKVALSYVDELSDYKCTPDTINRVVSRREIDYIRDILKDSMPILDGDLIECTTCIYTGTVDGHFIIDYLPNSNKNVVIASPCSGHGFKFSSVIGEIIADLTLNGNTKHDISLFKVNNGRNSDNHWCDQYK